MTAGLASDTPHRMGRNQINDPEETTSARFVTGTLARIKAALLPKESMNGFLKAAVARELRRRERQKPNKKPTNGSE